MEWSGYVQESKPRNGDTWELRGIIECEGGS